MVSQEAVLATLRANGPMTTLEIIAYLGIEHTSLAIEQCGKKLRSLEKFDMVRIIGTTAIGPRHHRTNIWEAVE